jgi:asparagine synthase (glutamine-hydrolysing)
MKNKLLRTEGVLRSSLLGFNDRLLQKQNGFRSQERLSLITSADSRPAIEFVEDALKPAAGLDSYTQLNYWLTKVSLPDDMLTKVDRASMAQSLEARLPFLDHRIVELMWSVSMDVRLKGYTRKHILRATMGPKLPSQLLSAKKRGFVLPLRDWMRNGNAVDVGSQVNYLCSKGLINHDALTPILAAHKRGDRDAANALWTLGMLSYSIES